MNSVQEVLASLVKENGNVKVLVNGDYLDLSKVEGVTNTNNDDADVYVVNNTSVDIDMLKSAKAVVYASNSKINFRPSHQPESIMSKTSFRQMILTDNLVVYLKSGMLLNKPEPQPEPVVTTIPPPPQEPVVTPTDPNPDNKPTDPPYEVPVGTTFRPEPFDGTPLSINGGEEVEKKEE